MNCRSVQSSLSAYLDRELTGQELLELRAHLAECSECRAEETELRNLKSLLGNMSAPEPSDDFADRLCATVLKAERRADSRWTWKKSLATFSSVAVASMAITFFGLSLGTKTPEVVAQPTEESVALEIARDQAYSVGTDPTEGASITRFANYAGR